VRHFDQGQPVLDQEGDQLPSSPSSRSVDTESKRLETRDKVLQWGMQLKKIFEQKSVRRMFRDWDKNFDGQLDAQEFASALERHGFKTNKEEVDMMMHLLDDDYDGTVRYNEFAHLMEEHIETGLTASAEVRYSLDSHAQRGESPTQKPPSIPGSAEQDSTYVGNILPAGGQARMLGGAFATATPGQWRLPAQWAEQPFPEPLRRFQKLIRQYVDPRPSVRDVFREWDKDKDGFLSWKEFHDGLVGIDFSQIPDEDELKLLFNQLDASDGTIDGKIDFNAFRLLTKPEIKDPQSTVRPRTGEINGFPVLPQDHHQHMLTKSEPPARFFTAKAAIKALNEKMTDRKTSMEMFMFFNWNPNPLEPKEAMLSTDFRRGLSLLNIELQEDEFDKMWEEIDADGSGELDYYEFLDAFYPQDVIQKVDNVEMESMDFDEAFDAAEEGAKKPVVQQVMQRFGEKFASNSRAFRNLKDPNMPAMKSEDLHKLLQLTTYGLSKEQADEVLRHADQTDDGFIDYAEFCNTMMPQERNRKGNPMQLLKTKQSSFKAKRESTNREFSITAVPFAKSFGAAATGGRYGYSWRNNRNYNNTFRNLQPQSNTAPNQYLSETDRLNTTARSGLLSGYGGMPDVPLYRAEITCQNRDRVMQTYDRLDKNAEQLKSNRIKNIYNRRLVYVNTLHHDERNAPRLTQRFNHG